MELYERPEVHRRRWALLGVLTLGLALVIMSLAGINVAFADMQRELGVSLSVLQWINNAYAITFGGLLLTAGTLGDRYGRKGALQIGLVFFAGSALIGGIATSAAVLVAARAAMGLGAAFIMPTTLSMIPDIFAPRERARAVAIWSGVASIGGALGPLVTGAIMTGWWFLPAGGWEWALLYNVPVAGAMLLAAMLWLPKSRDPHATPIDPPGAAMSLVAISGLIFGIIEGPERGWTSWPVLGSLTLALAVGAAFVSWEKRAPNPMLPLGLFRDRRFSLGTGVIGVAFMPLVGFWYLIVLYVQFSLGYTPLEAGLTTQPEAAAGLLMAAFTPNLTDRFGSTRVMAAGFVVLTVAFGMLGMAGPETSYGFLAGPIALTGIGLSLTTVPATYNIMAATPAARAGVGSAVNNTSRELGASFGIAVLGTLAAVVYRRALDPAVVPPSLAESAADSPGAALQSAQVLESSGEMTGSQVAAFSSEVVAAFSHSFAAAMLGGAAICAVCVVVVLVAGRRRGETSARPAPSSGPR